MPTSLAERHYLSQYARDVLGLVVEGPAGPVDADGPVLATLRREDASLVSQRAADRLDVGKYGIALTSTETAIPGNLSLIFTYTVNAVQDVYSLPLEVGPVAPAYDSLAPDFRAVVEAVWVRFADLFDSPNGGPNLDSYAQSHFGRNRLAQLLRVAIGRLNTIAQPYSSYSLDLAFPFAQWGALVEQALYVEIVKHLIRSYVEQPEVVLGVSVSRLDRRDYLTRWSSVLAMEETDLKLMMDTFKIAHMGLGSVSVLVAGGAYGRGYAATFPGAGASLARGYFAVRRV